jgi:hypothetical protein
MVLTGVNSSRAARSEVVPLPNNLGASTSAAPGSQLTLAD